MTDSVTRWERDGDIAILTVDSPPVNAISPLGSGDVLAAAYTWAMARGASFTDALRWGVASGTASARLAGMQFATLEQASEIYKQVEVRSAD